MDKYSDEPQRSSVAALTFTAVGIIFGDIGTSPLYAMKETFAGPHPLPLDRAHVLEVLSLIFWSITCIVSIKYVTVMMRADNRGEGGSLALLALASRAAEGRAPAVTLVGTLGIFATALFYGDSMITPAISVLSAVEGLNVARPELGPYVLPLTTVILLGLFLIQRHGTATVGTLFWPVMVLWFVVLAILGVRAIALNPQVLWALSPHHAVNFFVRDGVLAFLAMGSVFLVVTGAEALYADMGHFGRLPIRLAWYLFALPALILNYFGQGALLLANPGAIENPFFRLAPPWAVLPLVVLATLATVIASQAVISGAFSATRQAIQLGYVPRMTIQHTSEKEKGQIYIPFLNWSLMVFVVALVLGFGSSSNLAAAYGVAVSGTMLISTMLIAVIMATLWKWSRRKWVPIVAVFLAIDAVFFLANATKIPHGGWFPLVIGFLVFVTLTTWKRGRELIFARRRRDTLTIEEFLNSLSENVVRIPGRAVFFTGPHENVPASLLHNLKHNKVLHERVILLTVLIEDIPFVPESQRIESADLGKGLRRLALRFGYMQTPDVPKAFAHADTDHLGFFYEPMSISYFLNRVTVVPSLQHGLSFWRKCLFAWMVRSSTSAMKFFHLPINRVVEMGSQVDI